MSRGVFLSVCSFQQVVLVVLSAGLLACKAGSVLLIGDSISLEYWVRVQNHASPEHEVFHIGENGLSSSNGVSKINTWLDSPKWWDASAREVVASTSRPWDVIHFNFGLHDIVRIPDNSSPPAATIANYVSNLETIIGAMRAHSPSATLVFGTITPIQPQANRLVSDVSLYNAAAVAFMDSEGIYVNDFYAEMLPLVDVYSRDGTHFTGDGSQFLAENVVSAINSVPEPSGAWLLAGSFGLFFLRRR